MDKIIYFSMVIFLSLLSLSCQKSEKIAFESESVVNLFSESPEIIPDSLDYPLELELPGSVDLPEFKLVEVGHSQYYKWWKRIYLYSNTFEYRFYIFPERCHYLIGIGADSLRTFCFYIKWRQNINLRKQVHSKGDILKSEIGINTEYLETNLSEYVINKYFPLLKCKIVVKKPKKIIMDLNAIQLKMAMIDEFPKFIY